MIIMCGEEKIYENDESREIVLDKQDFKALSSDVRVEILKKLDFGCKTLRKLSDELNLPKSTVHENLAILVKSGFVEKRNEGSKWVYYELTDKGRTLLHPHEKIKIILLLSSAALSYTGGIVEILLFIQEIYSKGNVKGIFHPEYLITGVIFVAIGTMLLYSALRKKLR